MNADSSLSPTTSRVILLLGAGLMLSLAIGLALAANWRPEGRQLSPGLSGDAKRGQYILRMAGCVTCHTQERGRGAYLAGGRALRSPFGTFYAPNITPDRDTGIGGWTTEQFVQAVTAGMAPNGTHYYPAFPYTSYTRMTDQDLVDLKAYLDTVEPVRSEVPAQDLGFPYNLRFALGIWKRLFFEEGSFVADPTRPAAWNRGAYIASGPGHCRECHARRNFLGGFAAAHLAGAIQRPGDTRVPNITPHDKTGIGSWTEVDIAFALETGLKPNGDAMGGSMAAVVENRTSHLTAEDLAAIATYLRALDPVQGISSQRR